MNSPVRADIMIGYDWVAGAVAVGQPPLLSASPRRAGQSPRKKFWKRSRRMQAASSGSDAAAPLAGAAGGGSASARRRRSAQASTARSQHCNNVSCAVAPTRQGQQVPRPWEVGLCGSRQAGNFLGRLRTRRASAGRSARPWAVAACCKVSGVLTKVWGVTGPACHKVVTACCHRDANRASDSHAFLA